MTTRCPRPGILLFISFLGTSPLAAAPAPPATTGTADIDCGATTVRVQFYADDIVRIEKRPKGAAAPAPSLVVVAQPRASLAVARKETPGAVALTSARLQVTVTRPDGVVSFATPAGRPIVAEAGPAQITPVDVPLEKAFSSRQTFRLMPEEGLYGLGQHQDGHMSLRGRKVLLVQANTDAVTPFFISTAGYGVLWDQTSKTVFEDGPAGASMWSEVGDGVDYYLSYGPDLDAVIAGYRHLTGPAPMYGKWAYGYWQSKEHYHTKDELLKVAAEYRRRRIPIDNMIQDWNYWGTGANWSGMTFDPERYPDPNGMVKALHDMNYHLMISIWPGLGPESAIYKEMEAKGFLYPPVGWAGFRYYDVYNPEANEVYWKHLERGIVSTGMDGYWIDSTEPDIINALTKESQDFEMKRTGRNHLGSFHRYLNPYSLVMMDALYKKLRAENDAKRVYLLTRSTFAGQQRTAATTWSGDIGATWDVYKKQIPAGINHSMAGIPYWTFDIGAFVISSYGGTFSRGGKDPAYQELYARMFQFGTFAPIFRAHGSETPREIWEFGPFSDMMVKFDTLRYRLLPYIYSLAWRVTSQGDSIMRGLAMDFGGDGKTHDVGDQFLFGPALMVSPVTEYQLHRPPEETVLVSPEHFRTPDGTPGLLARYYKDTKYTVLGKETVDPNIDVYWYTGRPDYVTDQTLSIRWEGSVTPKQTGPHQFHIKAFGGRRIFLEGRELKLVSQSTEIYTEILPLEAGKAYALKVELENATSGALRMKLHWKTPDIFAREAAVEERPKTRPVYLPAGSSWTDFWTGETQAGGRTVIADAPIDILPLFVRAGSIVPMGPVVQYATEKPADPIELRVYPGADGSFTIYEDENDGYAYEKGVHATIRVEWNDAARKLVLGAREGRFPGMLEKRTFQVVLVRPKHGTGVDAEASPDKVVTYDGSRQEVVF